MRTVSLIWENGAQEIVYTKRVWVEANVLVLETERGAYRYIPLAQLREWTVTE